MTTFLTKSGKQYQQFTDWTLANAYRSGDVVIYGNANFRANGDIPANTAFAVGTSGATWYPINNGGIAEYGEQVLASDVNASATTGAYADVMSFTLPTAGTWEVDYMMTVEQKQNNNWTQFVVTDNSNNIQTGSASSFGFVNLTSGFSSTFDTLTGKLRITTTGSAVYKIRSVCSYNSNASNPAIVRASNSKVSWKKISGFVPATGQQAGYAKYTSAATTQAPITVNSTAVLCATAEFASNTTNIAWDTVTGTLTLQPGITYRIRGRVGQMTGGTGTAGTIQWYQTSGTAAYVGTPSRQMSSMYNSSNSPSGGTAEYTVTPSATSTYQLRFQEATNVSSIGGDARWPNWIEVEQLGTTATTGFVGAISSSWSLSNSYAAGTIVVQNGQLYQANSSIASGTAFTVGTGANTWSLVGFGTVAPEYGQVSASSGSSTITLTGGWDTVPDLTFTVPTTGVYELNSHITRTGTTSRLSVTYAINGTAQDTYLQHFGYGSYEGGMDSVFIASLTAGQVITIVVKNTDGAGGSILNDSGRRASMRWKKISGFVPTLGSVAGYARYKRTAVQTALSANSVIACDVQESLNGTGISANTNTGTITLTAGNTYRLRGAVGDVVGSASGSYASFQWWDLTNSAWVGSLAATYSPTSTSWNSATSPVAEAVITPGASNVTYQLRLVTIGNSSSVGTAYGYPWYEIEQLGTTNSSAFTGMMTTGYSSSNTYAAGTIVVNNGLLYQANGVIPAGTTWTVGASGATWTQLTSTSAAIPSWTSTVNTFGITTGGTAPTLPSGGLMENKLQYKQLGPKTWEVIGKLYLGTNSGGSAGSGDYLLTLPNGLSFDSSVINQGPITGNNGLASAVWAYQALPDSSVNYYYNGASEGSTGGTIVPYSATQYRVCLVTSQTMTNSMTPWGSAKVPLNTSDLVVLWRFRFQSL